MIRPPPRSTLTATRFPYTTLFRAVRMRRIGVHHGGVGPAGGTLRRHRAGDRLLVGDQQVHLERPGRGSHDAFIGEVVDLDEGVVPIRSEEHTSELQSLMRISYAVFCLKKNTQ